MSSSFAPLPIQSNMLSEQSINKLPSYKKKDSSLTKQSMAPPPSAKLPLRRSRHKGQSSVSNITGNTPLRAAQNAAIRASKRSLSPPLLKPTPDSFATRLQQTNPSKPSVTYRLPTVLPRPKNMPMVTGQSLAAIDPGLEKVALPFVKDTLQAQCEPMLRGLSAVDTKSSPLNGLPRVLRVPVVPSQPDVNTQLPTHLICAIDEKSAKGQLYPVHSLVLAAHCARLPSFPSPATPSSSPESIELPVIPLTLPHIASFPILFDYLYTHNFARFISSLIPLSPPPVQTETPEQRLKRVADLLAESWSTPELLERLRFVHGLWSNVCSLGIAEEGVWKVMNMAWAVLVRALLTKTQ